jgi:hypothetical protein
VTHQPISKSPPGPRRFHKLMELGPIGTRRNERDALGHQQSRASPAHAGAEVGRWVCLLLFFLMVSLGCSVFFSNKAFARPTKEDWPREHPMITSSRAAFDVPIAGTATWTLRLWAINRRPTWADARLLGQVSGRSGILAVVMPMTKDCWFQADVTVKYPGQNDHFYSGDRALVGNCVTTTTHTTRPTPITTRFSPTPTVATSSSEVPSPVKTSSGNLAFTGVGPGIRVLVAVGIGLLILGGIVLVGLPRTTAVGRRVLVLWRILMGR